MDHIDDLAQPGGILSQGFYAVTIGGIAALGIGLITCFLQLLHSLGQLAFRTAGDYDRMIFGHKFSRCQPPAGTATGNDTNFAHNKISPFKKFYTTIIDYTHFSENIKKNRGFYPKV